MNNIVTTTWHHDSLFESDNPTGSTVLIDTSVEKGGGGKGASPKALMLSSLAGCSGFDIVGILKKMRIDLDDFKIITTGELTDEHPKYYHSVLVEYQFFGKDLPKEKLQKAVDLSVEKY